MGKRKSGFNTPFEKLTLPAPAPKPQPEPRPTPKPKPEPKIEATSPPEPAETGEALFHDAMRTVAPLATDPRGRLGPIGARLEIGRPPRRSRAADEAEAYAELADLVDGDGLFDISATDEFIEGLAPGIDRRLLKKLRRGDYAVQDHVDLHGLVQTEAREEVERFLDGARQKGHRCVLIVHGRGLHSKESVPVLKERMKVWLTRGRLARGVLAFSSARSADGGAGAIYVLLRR